MFFQLIFACLAIAATVVIQTTFMSFGVRVWHTMETNSSHVMMKWPSFVLSCWVVFFIVPIILDVLLWATLYRSIGALPNFEDALYFSIVTFTTVGYGDIVLDRNWRVLSTFEAVNGWIIFGWATALLMVAIQRLFLPLSAGPSK